MEFRSIIQSKLSKEDHIDFDADDVPFFCFVFAFFLIKQVVRYIFLLLVPVSLF